jgi:tRNA pseudouridine13 synthase
MLAQRLLISNLEKSIGLEVYATKTSGLGGNIKQTADDFVVEEILVDGSKAEIDSRVHTEKRILNSASAKQRYLLCVMVKRNWDTFMAIRNIAQKLGINPTQVQIAGIKDARAITAQHVTIENKSVQDVQNINLKDIELRPIGYLRNRMSPYYLMGNDFRITIRNVRHSKSIIGERIAKTLEEIEVLGGIPNFFGHQRFGTTRPITHLVGKAIVEGNLKKAAMLFLAKPSNFEHPSSKTARQELQETQNFQKALANFPKQLRYERSMIRSLAEDPDDFSSAFRRLPMRLLRIFVQAYQSYLFNRFLSSRIGQGLSLTVAQPGDNVVRLEKSGLPMPAMHKEVDTMNLSETNHAIQSGRLRIALPLIGLKQDLSGGVQGDLEREILAEESVSPEDFRVESITEMSSKGELRTIISPLRDFHGLDITKDLGKGQKHAVKLAFTLYRGSYATVILRELAKTRSPIRAGF